MVRTYRSLTAPGRVSDLCAHSVIYGSGGFNPSSSHFDVAQPDEVTVSALQIQPPRDSSPSRVSDFSSVQFDHPTTWGSGGHCTEASASPSSYPQATTRAVVHSTMSTDGRSLDVRASVPPLTAQLRPGYGAPCLGATQTVTGGYQYCGPTLVSDSRQTLLPPAWKSFAPPRMVMVRIRIRMKYIAGTFLGCRRNGNMRVAPKPMVFNGLTIVLFLV